MSAFERDGFAVVPGILDDGRAAHLAERIASVGAGYALRRLLVAIPDVRALAEIPAVRRFVNESLGPTGRLTRAVFFDKLPGANWKVAWHQDLSVAVSRRIDVPGWAGWSVKAGVVHVQPPAEFLESVVVVRLHLDNCGAHNGPLKVVPGSHRLGRLSDEDIIRLRRERGEVVCVAPRGGAVLIRPLLLHASSAAEIASHRRVVSLEFSSATLPAGLEWTF